MDFGWETQTERLKRHMSITPKKKLEFLYELSRFTRKYALKSLKDKAINDVTGIGQLINAKKSLSK